MAEKKHYRARKNFKLDCGHTIKAGETFVVTRTFSCEDDAERLTFQPSQQEQNESGIIEGLENHL